MKPAFVALLLLVLNASPAYAFDPDACDACDEADAPAPAPIQIPGGLYRINEVYAGDVVTRAGDLTTYATLTTHRLIDTYARVIETVSTGARSAFDGDAFNGRAALSDGALVAGTYYQNFVFTGAAYVPVSIVFFQDDSELARHASATPTVVDRPGANAAPSSAPVVTAPVGVAPVAVPSTSPRPAALPSLGPVAIGVDPSGGAALLTSLEVARGAAYHLRVNVAGAPLVAWTVVGGTNDAANAGGWHAPDDRLEGQWLRLPAPGTAWDIRLRVRVVGPAGVVEREGTIAIWVRSPAVIE